MTRAARVLQGVQLADDDGEGGASAPVDLVVVEGVIDEIRPTGRSWTGAEVIDGAGLLATPGLVNGHTHSHEALYRGRYSKLPLEVWMHYPRPPKAIELTPEDVYARTAMVALDMLRGGATTVVDDLAIPTLDPAHVDAARRAYEDVGVRARIGVSVFDLPYFHAVPFVEDEMPKSLRAELLALPTMDPSAALTLVDKLVGSTDPHDDRVAFIAAPSAPQRCTDDFLLDVMNIARRHSSPVIMHVNETRLQVVTAQVLYGATMVGHLDHLGAMGPSLSLIHGIWFTDADARIMARAGTTVQHNPVCNLRLGSGLASVFDLISAGVNVSLGTDGMSSCISVSMHDSARHAGLMTTLRSHDPSEWLGASEIESMATVNGARALGLADKIGQLRPGMRADVVCYRLSESPFVPLNNARRQWLYAEAITPELVIVDGRIVLRGGKSALIRESDVLAAVTTTHRRLQPKLKEVDQFVRENLQPVYERIYRRAEAIPIDDTTFAARIGA